ncbi:MAG: DUF4827 family protein [Paludibacteraceae bacterium]|jgi:FKBP-type peptidyl-prolyl cis-trans isomerase|nr:DUF4827 family protein [Paludibacteraceae bacterium]
MLSNVRIKLMAMGALAACLLLSACNKDKTYADYLDDEKSAISSYLKNNQVEVVSSRPDSAGEWLNASGKPVYYKFSDGLYYHQIDKGDTTTLAPKTGCTVYIRYIGKTLSGTTLFDCSSAVASNPQNFKLISSPSSDNTFGEGFQKAVRCLYAGGHCIAIIPFKIGNGYNNTVSGSTVSDAGDYTPMRYEIWVTRIE